MKRAVICVAGKGTRMSPITNIIAKELLPIGITPVLDFIVNEAIDSGVEYILFIINREKVAIPMYYSGVIPEDFNASGKYYPFVAHEGVKAAYVYQDDPKGTGDAVKRARKFTNDEPFGLMYGDDITVSEVPCLKQLADLSEEKGDANVLAIRHEKPELAALYATVVSEDFNGVYGIVNRIDEKVEVSKIKSDLTSYGRYVLNSDIFEYIDKIGLRKGEYYLTDAIAALAIDRAVYALIPKCERYDTGNPQAYCDTFKELCGY